MVLMQGIPIREIICGGHHSYYTKKKTMMYSDLEVIIWANSD